MSNSQAPTQTVKEVLAFTRYYQLPEGATFTLPYSSLAYLHNLRVNTIEDKLTLVLDPNNVLDFVRQDAALNARIALLSELINISSEE